jgi:DNA-binding response OmpR family regulator
MTANAQDKKATKILIIEDERSLADLLTAKMNKEGFEVDFAYDGEEGYRKIGAFAPDLILLDIQMPKMNGYEVLEKLKADGLSIPVIIISNSGQPVEIEKTKKLGAVDHLIKTEFSPDDVLRKVNDYLSSGGRPKAEPEFRPLEDAGARKLGVKVLLVEDDAFLREICSKKLTKEGYTVYEAMDGEQALNAVGKVDPDIVLLDIILPAIDGFQILNQIRTHEQEAVRKVPVIMLSNLGQDDDIKKAMEMGANDYLFKAHFTTEEIVTKIKETMGR